MRKWLSLLLVSILVFSIFGDTSAVYAKKNGNTNGWDKSTNVELDKEWTITFSQELNKGLLLDDFIYVLNSKGEKLDSHVYYDKLVQKIRVQAPSGGYTPQSDYTLVIEEGLQSKGKQKMNKTVKKPFTTGELFTPKEQFKERKESTNDVLFEEDVTFLEEQVVLTDQYDTHTIRVDSSRIYTTGDIIILPPTDQYPFGYAAKVVSVQSVTDGFTLKIVEPNLEEVLTEFDISEKNEVDAGDVVVSDELLDGQFSSSFVDQLGLLEPKIEVIEKDTGFSIHLSDVGYEFKKEGKPVDGVTINGEGGIRLSGTIDFDNPVTTLDVEKEKWYSIPVVHNLGFSAEQKLELAADMYGEAMVDMKFPLADVPVPYASLKGGKFAKAGVFVRLFLLMKYDAEGKAHFSVSQEYLTGTGLNRTDKGEYKPYSTFERKDPVFKVEDLKGHLGMNKGLQVDVAGVILQWDLVALQNKGTFDVGVEAGKLFETADIEQYCYDFGASLNYAMTANVLAKSYEIFEGQYSVARFSNCELKDLNFAEEKLELDAGSQKKLAIHGNLLDGSKIDFLLPHDFISFSSTNPDIKVDSRGYIKVSENIKSGADSQIIMRYKTTHTEIEKSLPLVIKGLEEEVDSGDTFDKITMGESIIRKISPDSDSVFKFIPSKEELQTHTHAMIGFESDIAVQVSLYTSAKKLEMDKPYQVSSEYIKVPLAFEGPYYVKVTSKREGEFRAEPAYETDAPQDHPNGGACAVETTTTDRNVIRSLQYIRDEFLVKTEQGENIVNLYNKLSPTLVWSIMKNSTLRNNLLNDLKSIDQLIVELYKVAEGKDSSYVITEEEAIAVQSILETIKDYLPEQQVVKLENMQDEMNVENMANEKLTVFLEGSELIGAVDELNLSSEIIVKLKDQDVLKNPLAQAQSIVSNATYAETDLELQTEPLYTNGSGELANTFVVKVENGQHVRQLIAELENTKAVEYVELNQPYTIQTSDVNYSYQWPLSNSNSVVGGDLQYESLIRENKNHSMKDVIVAVVDTGVNHELADFKNIVLADKGYDFVNNDQDAMDDNDHGTHVAGIIGARADNGYSMAGLNQHTKIIPIKVLNSDGRGTSINIARGIVHAVDNGAQVINLSLGTGSKEQTIENAITYAIQHEVTVVAAAGNDGSGKISYPASSANTISVGATTSAGILADFSNYGQGIDLVAPGESIPSLVTSGEVMFASGTSMATPYAAAQIALFYSLAQDMDSDRALALISDHHIDLGDTGYDLKYGWGLLDTVKAIQSLK
ncbi:hypothetical protein CSV67_09250 [Sporosarcina sp. P2]|uniref:S8 family peptidase n=1 Tax=Sporosarcina sp. P2 TaxID=2048251 RepID=UPI000C16C960|nr:S8 family peptidase [Sporosarcina sp. P2]PID02477.1 hypothetical protein CSV67_09250 [Sporosarcina sp. P2]